MDVPTYRGKEPVALVDPESIRHQAEGAMLNGTRFVKVAGDPEDLHKLGEMGTVIGSIWPPGMPEAGYFVTFDGEESTPTNAVVFLRAYKIRAVPEA